MKLPSGWLERTAFAAVGIAILCGLGVWQLHRKVWKENLIASLDARMARPPVALPPRSNWTHLSQAHEEFTHVDFAAEFLPGQEALVYSAGNTFRPDVTEAGYWVFAPAKLAGGGIVIVDRGFVPSDRKSPASRAEGAPKGSIHLVGIVRWPEKPGMFTPAADTKARVWYARDIKAMAAAEHWGRMGSEVAPFYVEQESPMPPGGWPKPGKLVASLPDNHLQYALTWFGLALGLAAFYLIWLMRRLRQPG